MSPMLTTVVSDNDSFPRVSGDETRGEIVHVETGVFSPRERG